MTAVYALLDAENRRLRQIYLAHSARAEFRDDAVMPQRSVGCEFFIHLFSNSFRQIQAFQHRFESRVGAEIV